MWTIIRQQSKSKQPFLWLCVASSLTSRPQAAARYPAWLPPHPPALCSVPGSCWLVHKEASRCLLPAGLATCWLPVTRLLLPCSPAGIMLLSWCPESPAEWQLVFFHCLHLFIHFISKCMTAFSHIYNTHTSHWHLLCPSAFFFPAPESAWISWCGAAGSI